MPLDVEADRKQSWDGSIDDDARAAYEEVMGRSKAGSEASAAAGSGEGTASRTQDQPDNKPDIKPDKVETRDDGRDEKGRFAPKASEQPEAPAKPDKQPDTQPAAQAPADPAAQPVAGAPPPSFSVKTKAAWAQLPDHVKADIVKREQEMSQGLSALRDYRDLKPYAELAQKHNTSIKDYIDRTMRIENLIRSNPKQGFAAIAQNFGLSREQAATMFAEMAQVLGGRPQASGQPGAPQGAPGQPQDPLDDALSPVFDRRLQPIMQQMRELEQIKGEVAAMRQADRNAKEQQLVSAIEKFASDPANAYFDNLAETMTQLMASGMVPKSGNTEAEVRAAYDMAARLHPEVHEALIEQRLAAKEAAQRKAEQEAADKAKHASRSLTGSSMPGARVVETTGKRPDGVSYDDDLEADVLAAFRKTRRA